LKHTYKIGKLIGQGNYGKVYSATLKRDPLVKVAIKVLDKKNMDNEDLQSLKHEVGVMQTIDHPNIVKYIESYSDERFLYLVMQMCEGGTLFDSYDKAVKHGSKLTEKRAVEILEKLFRAINHCHAQNIIHRDIKPANIMYDKSG